MSRPPTFEQALPSGMPRPTRGLPHAPVVEYTISEDRTAGHAAHAESGFAQLAAAPPGGFGIGVPTAHALQDYQMQLELLEQQNRKRIMMARREQNMMEMGGTLPFPQSMPPPPPPPAPNMSADLVPVENIPINLSAAGGNEDQAREEMEAQAPAGPIPDATVTGAPDFTERHIILHRVVCGSLHPKCDGLIYDGEPCGTIIDGVLHLSQSHTPAFNPATFLERRGQPTAFIVYRELHCDSDVDSRSNMASLPASGLQTRREVISVVSGELHAALQRISQFAPNHDAYVPGHRNRQHGKHLTPLLSRTYSEYTHYFIYHHREALREATATTPGSEDVRALQFYVENCPDPMYGKCDRLFSKGRVSAETLPWLFRPNEVLVCKDGSVEVACVLRCVPAVGASNAVELDCWNWGYDGSSLRRKDKPIRLSAPTYGTVPIKQLSAYPLRYADEATKQRLFERGNHFWALRNQTHVSYEGPDYQGERVYPGDSRCVIDYQMYRMFHSHAEAFQFTARWVVSFDSWPQEIDATTAELSRVNTMLLPPGIHGFFLKDKKWVHLHVDNIAPIKWNKEAYDRLVLPQRIKKLVKALVLVRKKDGTNPSANESLQAKRSDLIKGKGGGLIMLLHGGPGTGKTLTAESVADLAEMPLYNVTCGDVGTKPEAVEKYLNSVLHLGQKWNCVLLLDEADVFLEQRSLSDLKRNSLVSVFLRTLEYYDGILILTSNRVGTFDSAFKSRIQVALHYPCLDQPSRHTIWQNFFDMLRTDGEDADFDDIAVHMDELAAHEMNGRQIRNAVTTARQLALFEGARLGWEHVDQAIAAAADFDSHLRKVGAMSEEEWVMDGVSVVTGRMKAEPEDNE